VAHPQIAAFARLAEGGTAPNRRIEGQKTLLARTIHGIHYDDRHDEIVVGNPFAQSVLTFRGGADGEEAPIRVIQGPQTQLGYPDKLALDPVHDEIFVPNGDAVVVFSRQATGNVAPIRVLKGPDALRSASEIAVDPVNNLLLVTGTPATGRPSGQVMIFDRTAQGNTRPLRVIRIPYVGGGGRLQVYPPRGWILVVVRQSGEDRATNRSFVGVWSINDSGAVPPRWMIGGPGGDLLRIWDLALDVKNKMVMISDMALNAVLTYSFPEIF
jgi:hypothetical protein